MLRSILAMAFIATVVAAPSASANQGASNQGGKIHGSGGDAGSRANIEGGASVPSAGAVIASVRVQNAADTALFQVGHLLQGNGKMTDCGPPGTTGYMVERKAVDSKDYVCNHFEAKDPVGSEHKFSVLYASDPGWIAYIDGKKRDGPYTLGFTSGKAMAVGEYMGSPPTSYSMTFGFGIPWQYTFNGTNWFQPGSARDFNGGGWLIEPLPSPFTISRSRGSVRVSASTSR